MPIPRTALYPIPPIGPAVGATDERSRFYGCIQASREVRIQLDPSDMACLRPRGKAPFASGRERRQRMAFLPGLPGILRAKYRAGFRTGIDGAVTIFSLRSADCDGLNFRVANARPYWPPMLPIIVAAPEAETEAATIYKLRA
jgi:hypothetical protein